MAPKLYVAFNHYEHDHTLGQARDINSYLGKIEFKQRSYESMLSLACAYLGYITRDYYPLKPSKPIYMNL